MTRVGFEPTTYGLKVQLEASDIVVANGAVEGADGVANGANGVPKVPKDGTVRTEFRTASSLDFRQTYDEADQGFKACSQVPDRVLSCMGADRQRAAWCVSGGEVFASRRVRPSKTLSGGRRGAEP